MTQACLKSEPSAYTLQDYYTAAGVQQPISFAPYIGMKYQPKPHQIKNLNTCLTQDRWGLYDSPGTGKTLTAHAIVMFWLSEGHRTLALMPPILCEQFKQSLYEDYPGSHNFVDVHILKQDPKERATLYADWKKSRRPPSLLCMSYQMFLREHEKIAKLGYKVVIADEVQFLKSHESRTYRALTGLLGNDSYLLTMTGTPSHNGLKDNYALIELVGPGTYNSWRHFERLHMVYKQIRLKEPKRTKRGKLLTTVRIHAGYTRTELLHEKLYLKGSRVTREAIAPEIKDPIIRTLAIDLDPAHLALYRKLVREKFLELGNEEIVSALNEQSMRQKCLQIVTCPHLFVPEGRKIKNTVFEAVDTLIDGMDIWDSKLILFCQRRSTIAALEERLEKYRPALMYGDADSGKGRDQFLNDPDCRLTLANYKSAGAGLNLQDVCHDVVCVEPTGVPGDFLQAIQRVVRHGQKEQVYVTIIKALGTVAPVAVSKMLEKEEDVQRVQRDPQSLLDLFLTGEE